MQTSSNTRLIAFLILAFLALIWGSSFILIKLGLQHEYSPVELGATRLIMATLSLLPFSLRYLKKLSRSEFFAILAVGLVGTGIPATLFPLAQTVITSTTSGMLNSLSPLFTLIIGVLFFGFRFDGKKLIGVLIGLAGAAVLVFLRPDEGSDASFWRQVGFAMIAVLATVGYGLSTNIIKRYLNETSPLLVTMLATAFVALPYTVYMILYSEIPERIISGDAVVLEGLAYISVFGIFGTGLALLLFNRLVQITDPVVSASVTYLIPIVALGWGIFDNEPIGYAHILGMVIILAGVWLVNSKKTTPLKDKA
jgi:drug/metabolite transporter (DMT)-like permease